MKKKTKVNKKIKRSHRTNWEKLFMEFCFKYDGYNIQEFIGNHKVLAGKYINSTKGGLTGYGKEKTKGWREKKKKIWKDMMKRATEKAEKKLQGDLEISIEEAMKAEVDSFRLALNRMYLCKNPAQILKVFQMARLLLGKPGSYIKQDDKQFGLFYARTVQDGLIIREYSLIKPKIIFFVPWRALSEPKLIKTPWYIRARHAYAFNIKGSPITLLITKRAFEKIKSSLLTIT